jgi:hypothetical protein
VHSRLKQHFLVPNKDRSIFRKNVGRALLNRARDPFLSEWEVDRTGRIVREQTPVLDGAKQEEIERRVSTFIQSCFTFSVVRVESKAERLRLESRMISTVSLCRECQPSPGWLGLSSPKEKIRRGGLWLVNELYKTPLTDQDLALLRDQKATST